mgnify:FL=1
MVIAQSTLTAAYLSYLVHNTRPSRTYDFDLSLQRWQSLNLYFEQLDHQCANVYDLKNPKQTENSANENSIAIPQIRNMAGTAVTVLQTVLCNSKHTMCQNLGVTATHP